MSALRMALLAARRPYELRFLAQLLRCAKLTLPAGVVIWLIQQ